jgi:SAM-dependent methyltransferase
MVEFTGERIVPGCVDDDLFHEHHSRYAFAASLAANKRCLDAGCGLGYGTAMLAAVAESVHAVDIDPITVAEAKRRYCSLNTHYAVADVTAVPYSASSFDLIISFEVVEHLSDWGLYLRELARLASRNGIVLVSTPNRDYYAVSRGDSGPNPFHVHEFSYDEFRDALGEMFPYVEILGQNVVPGISFFSDTARAEFSAYRNQERARVADAQFYLAVCSHSALPPIPEYLYLAATGNVLSERARHINLLEQEIKTKTQWLNENTASLSALQAAHLVLEEELRQRSAWALEQTAHLEAQNQRLAGSLEEKCRELETAVNGLRDAEKLVEDRTRWAKDLDSHNLVLRDRIAQLEEELTTSRECLNATREELDRSRGEMENLQRALDDTAFLRHQELGLLAGIFGMESAEADASITSIAHAAREALKRSEERLQLLHDVQRSRWLRLGRRIGIGPDLTNLP